MNRWIQKFRFAFQGLAAGIRTQDSFWVHLPAALLACGLGAWLGLSLPEWGLLGREEQATDMWHASWLAVSNMRSFTVTS